MAKINWQSMTARYVCNLYRALYSFKWITTYWQIRRVKFRELHLSSNIEKMACEPSKLPGYVDYDYINKYLRVYCSDGKFICVKKLSVEGKTVMSAADFNNGFLKKVDQSRRYFTNSKTEIN